MYVFILRVQRMLFVTPPVTHQQMQKRSSEHLQLSLCGWRVHFAFVYLCLHVASVFFSVSDGKGT